MASSTSNVKLGVCQVFFDGIDLGYTKGGVEVEVSTETHEVVIDQFGKTAINQLVTGREVKVKAPLAETTLENMVRIMPGATLTQVGGVKASGTWTPGANPTNGQTVVIGGTTITLKTAGTAVNIKNECDLGANTAATLTNLVAMINASTDINLAKVTASATATVLTVTFDLFGTEGNTYTLAVGTAGGTVSGATLAGGVEPTGKRVDVTAGVGSDLLSTAKELRLHPFGKAASDLSDDFIVWKANTGGGLQFAYKLDDERVFSVEFTGYADSNGKVFSLGDPKI